MKYETQRKPQAVGGAAAAGRGPECPRVRACRDRPPAEDHAAERLCLAAEASPGRRRRPGCAARARPSVESDRAAEAGLDGRSSERGFGLRLRHGPLDLSADRRVDPSAMGRRVPRRRHSSADGQARFFPLSVPSGEPSSVTRRPSATGSSTTGRGSNAVRPGDTLTWFSLMKRASCCIRWSVARGRRVAKLRSFANAPATTDASRRSAGCPSRRNGDASVGTCSSTRTAASARNRSSTSCVICCGTCPGSSSWCGIALAPTAAARCGIGSGVAGVCVWSPCPATRRNSIRTSTGGRTSSTTGWPTTARRTWNGCTPRSWSSPATRRATKPCSARSFTPPDCRYDSDTEHSFYRNQ